MNASPPSPGRPAIPIALFVVALVVVAGGAIAATSVYFEVHPTRSAGPAPPATTSPPPSNNSSKEVRSPAPLWLNLTDDLGRTVEVPFDPARVAVIGPSIVDSMYRLGLVHRIVAVDCALPGGGGLGADYSPDQVTLWGLSSAMCVETLPDFDFEGLLNDSPELVLATTLISVGAVSTIQGSDHIPVLMLQPPTLSGIEVDVSLLGTLFNVSANASAIDTQLQQSLAVAANVSTNVTDAGTPLPTVLVTYDPDPATGTYPGYWSYGPGTFGESLVEFATAASITANSTLPYPLVTGDAVLVSDPEFIVYGTGFGLNESSYAQGPDWSLFGAVENNTTYGMNSNYLTEPDPTMILVGLPELLHLLHPDLVPAP